MWQVAVQEAPNLNNIPTSANSRLNSYFHASIHLLPTIYSVHLQRSLFPRTHTIPIFIRLEPHPKSSPNKEPQVDDTFMWSTSKAKTTGLTGSAKIGQKITILWRSADHCTSFTVSLDFKTWVMNACQRLASCTAQKHESANHRGQHDCRQTINKLLLECKVLTLGDKIAAKTMKSPITNQKVMQWQGDTQSRSAKYSQSSWIINPTYRNTLTWIWLHQILKVFGLHHGWKPAYYKNMVSPSIPCKWCKISAVSEQYPFGKPTEICATMRRDLISCILNNLWIIYKKSAKKLSQLLHKIQLFCLSTNIFVLSLKCRIWKKLQGLTR